MITERFHLFIGHTSLASLASLEEFMKQSILFLDRGLSKLCQMP